MESKSLGLLTTITMKSPKNEKAEMGMTKKQMMKHEKGEGSMARKMEYGNPKGGYCTRKPCK